MVCNTRLIRNREHRRTDVAQRRTTAGASGHPEFTLEYEPGIVTELGIEWLASWLQDCISSGTRFSVGQTIAIGWMNCYVTDRGDGTLGLSEPDFTNIPRTSSPAHRTP